MTDFAQTRSLFHLPPDLVYLDGNSLGPLPVAARHRIGRLLDDEWGHMLIQGWMMLPGRPTVTQCNSSPAATGRT